MTRPRENGRDWVQYSLIVANLAILVLVVVVIYWLYFDDNPPAEIFEIETSIEVAQPGDSFVATMNWCKYTNHPAHVHLSWVDDIMFNQPPSSPVFNSTGCHETGVLVSVPATLPPSEYRVYGEAEYVVNPLTTRTVPFGFGPITILPPDEP